MRVQRTISIADYVVLDSFAEASDLARYAAPVLGADIHVERAEYGDRWVVYFPPRAAHTLQHSAKWGVLFYTEDLVPDYEPDDDNLASASDSARGYVDEDLLLDDLDSDRDDWARSAEDGWFYD